MKRRNILMLCMAMVLAACAAGAPKKARYPNAVTPEIRARFEAADSLYRQKRFAEADGALEKIIAEFPYTEITDESRFLRGEIAFLRKDFGAAIAFYRQAVSDVVSPSIAPKAHFKAALSLHRLNRPQEAIDEIGKIDRRDASAILRMRADSLCARASKAAGILPNAAIRWHLFLLDDYADAAGVQPAGIPRDELIPEDEAMAEVRRFAGDKGVSIEEIEALPLKEMKGRRSGGYAAYKRALVLHSTGDTKAAIRQLKAYLMTYPKHEYYGAARLLMGELGGVIGEGAGISVGVLLPLTGKYAVHGESALHGIECALGVYEPCIGPAGMKLVIRNSESIPGGVVGAVGELAAEDVIAIVGPLLSASAMEAASRAQELGIPLISLSQREGVAEVGDYIFRNSVSDSSEMSTLADYAVERMGLKRFFVIYPPSKKGAEYRGLFTEAAKSLGGSVVGSQVFSPARHMEVMGDELRGRGAVEFKAWAGIRPEEKGEPAIDLTAIGENYDAIFIPDSISIAGYIAQRLALSAATKSRPQLLGISRWDDQKLVDRAGSYVEGAVFVDSFYKKAPDEHVASFVSQFRDAYGVEPTLLEALGYDSMRMIISAVQEKGAARRDSVRDALARTSGFPGITGRIAFNDQGDAKRELWVLKIKDGSIQPVK